MHNSWSHRKQLLGVAIPPQFQKWWLCRTSSRKALSYASLLWKIRWLVFYAKTVCELFLSNPGAPISQFCFYHILYLVLQTIIIIKKKKCYCWGYHHSHTLATIAVRRIIHTSKIFLASTATNITFIFLLANILQWNLRVKPFSLFFSPPSLYPGVSGFLFHSKTERKALILENNGPNMCASKMLWNDVLLPIFFLWYILTIFWSDQRFVWKMMHNEQNP